jgi:hypothetical protein
VRFGVVRFGCECWFKIAIRMLGCIDVCRRWSPGGVESGRGSVGRCRGEGP